MFTQAIHPDALRGLKAFSKLPFSRKCYLAGGTALALQIGHRISVDLDFFTPTKFDEEEVAANLDAFPEFEREKTAYMSVWGKMCGTKFSIFYYKYNMVSKTINFEGVNIAGKEDISAMKLHAIEDRGTKRDFIDLYMLAKEYSLEKIFDYYDLKYACLEEHLFPIIKSLNYFDDADREDWQINPLVEIDWREVKTFFNHEALRLSKIYLGI